MSKHGSEAIRHLIRLANDESLDQQSRQTICEIAQHVKNLHSVSQKISDLDMKLKAFGRSSNLTD